MGAQELQAVVSVTRRASAAAVVDAPRLPRRELFAVSVLFSLLVPFLPWFVLFHSSETSFYPPLPHITRCPRRARLLFGGNTSTSPRPYCRPCRYPGT